MIELLVSRPGNEDERVQLANKTRIDIGRSRDADIVIFSGRVARRHVMLINRDGLLSVEDLRSTNGTQLNGVRLKTRRLLLIGDTLDIADDVRIVLTRFEPVIAPDFADREASFLDPIARDPDDEAVREVYGDYLEEKGDTRRSSFLRAEIALRRSPNDAPLLADFRKIREELVTAPRWRMLVSRPRIEGCPRKNCTTRWGDLPQPPEQYLGIYMRTCPACQESVHFRDFAGEQTFEPQIIAIDRLGLAE